MILEALLSSVQDDEVAYKTTKASPKNKGLIEKRDKKGPLAAKAAYLIRDTMKVTGHSEMFPKPVCALFYVDLNDPLAGGTGHTIRVLDYAKQHPNAAANLSAWITVATVAKWQSIADVRKVLPHADLASVGSSKTVTIFNIAGNHHRLITAIHYNTRSIFILKILTHADYSKDRWKNDL